MAKIRALLDIGNFGIKEGEIYEIFLDFDLRGYVKKGKRKCYIERRVQRGVFQIL